MTHNPEALDERARSAACQAYVDNDSRDGRAAIAAAVRAYLAALPADKTDAVGVRRVRHKKLGMTYAVLGNAEVLIAKPTHDVFKAGAPRPLRDGDRLTVYQSEHDGGLWVRFPDEFEDGRFEDIEAAAPSPATAAVEEPVAYVFELARAINTTTREYCDWGKPQLSFSKPCVPPGSIRNLTALYATPPAPQPEPAADLVERAKAVVNNWLRYGETLGAEKLFKGVNFDELSTAITAFAEQERAALVDLAYADFDPDTGERRTWKAKAVEAMSMAADLKERLQMAEAELRRTDPSYTPLLDKYASDIQAYADRAEATEKALDFVALWAWRKDPPNATANLTDAERLSAIKHHPAIRARGGQS